ncbi:MAG: flagellar basal body rod protein FlgC [Myxococcales bacterium FL481]|nr:MAG: flagellar basal body rod protein FlgC [Myxococcales bacterium FL481]
MSFFDAFEIASSGMSAQRTRMNVSAMNMANKNTTRTPEGGPYRRRDVILAAVRVDQRPFATRLANNLDEEAAVGVRVQNVAVSDDPPSLHYDPGHPDANAEGYVEMPNVNGLKEMVNLMSAARAYEAGAKVLKTARTMAQQALRIGK